MPDGDVMPAWPVVELIERDEALTLLFSRCFWKTQCARPAT